MKKHLSFRPILLTSLLLTSILLVSCHKVCVCTGYDGAEHRYTADELDDRGVSCSNMIYQSGIQFYSTCSWE